jgi:thiol-disulfide isomerase/thioredoxin
MMSENRFRCVREISILHRLLPLGLLLCLWGCDDSSRPPGGAGGISDAAYVAQMFDENVPFEFDFDLEDVNGKRMSKTDFAGKVLIIDIWGTWCPPCRMEIPHFMALNSQYGDQGLQVIGLNYEQIGDKEQAARVVREFCKTQGVDYPCGLITQRIKRQIPGFGTFPTTLFLDRTGKVRLKAVGYHSLPLLQVVVERLLKEQPSGGAAPPAETESKPDDQAGR